MLARHSVAWRYETALTGTVQLRMSRIVDVAWQGAVVVDQSRCGSSPAGPCEALRGTNTAQKKNADEILTSIGCMT